jgi:SAM-dependent methyltransferase
MDEQTRCPICTSPVTAGFLRRALVPVHQNLVVKDRKAAVEIARGDLDLAACEVCGFVFNQTFDAAKLTYDQAYDNTQSYSPYFDAYMDALVKQLIEERGIRNQRIVEVGCGKGLFLKKLVGPAETGNTGYGFDPSYVGPDTDLDGRIRFERRYYGPDCTHIPADIVVCRHVIEHIADPIQLLQTIHQTLAAAPHARVFFETPCVNWILRNRVIWDFFYEHCSYFSAQSLTTAFELAGFHVERVDHVFGEQYLWLEATLATGNTIISKQPGATPALAQQFAIAENKLVNSWRTRVTDLAAQQQIALWGAGAKGVTFANLVDPNCTQITCVIDMNPQKQHQYIPGSGHPIFDYHELGRLGVSVALVLNPNYHQEIAQLLGQSGLQIELIDAMAME